MTDLNPMDHLHDVSVSAGLIAEHPGDTVATLVWEPWVRVQLAAPNKAAELTAVSLAHAVSDGFAPITQLDPGALQALPLLDGWRAQLLDGGAGLRVTRGDGKPFYDGTLGALPDGWLGALLQHRALAVLVAPGLRLGGEERDPDSPDDAAARGDVVGARVELARGA